MSSHSHALTQTGSESLTLTATGPRLVFAQIVTEVAKIALAAESAGVPLRFDVRAAVLDAAAFALLDLIGAVHLEFYANTVLVREYRYAIADAAHPQSGPPPEQPPLAAGFPPGTELRITVSRAAHVTQETFNAYTAARGWATASVLTVPAGATTQKYGAFSADGYCVERYLIACPDATLYRTRAPHTTATNERF